MIVMYLDFGGNAARVAPGQPTFSTAQEAQVWAAANLRVGTWWIA
jgi:hypothetical protein